MVKTMKRILLCSSAAAMLLFPVIGRAETSSGTAASTAAPYRTPPPEDAAYKPPEKRYFRALGETIVVGWSPWLFSHFVKDYPYADISWESVKHNLTHSPWWDADNFQT